MDVGECLISDSIKNKSSEPVATSDQSSKLEVNLSSSGLTIFQPDCSFGNIVELNLSNNKLSRIPSSVASLRRLQKLNWCVPLCSIILRVSKGDIFQL